MARYLFTVWSFPGHINPSIALAVAMRARGHDVAFYTGQRAVRTLDQVGLPYFPMRHVDEEAHYARLFPPDESAGRTAGVGIMRQLRDVLGPWLLDTVPGQMADLEPVMDAWRPDAIVCDPTIWAPFLILHEARAIPVAILSYTVGCPLPGWQAPPWGRGLPPPTTAWRRLRIAAERTGARMATQRFRREANRFRAAHALPPLPRSVSDHAGTMPLYLVTSVPELDYKRVDLPMSVHYVGRLGWDRPTENGPPPWIEDLPTDRPLVYMTEGTVHGRQPRLLRAARGLAGLPLHVLLTLNADCNPASVGLGCLPRNVELQLYRPGQGWQSDILPRASLVITNGGAGSILAALAAGVPLIVVPTAWDKPENARRVVESGAGIQLSPQLCTPGRLREAVRYVLREPTFRVQARRVSEALGRLNVGRATGLLEALCGGALTDVEPVQGMAAGSGGIIGPSATISGASRTVRACM